MWRQIEALETQAALPPVSSSIITTGCNHMWSDSLELKQFYNNVQRIPFFFCTFPNCFFINACETENSNFIALVD